MPLHTRKLISLALALGLPAHAAFPDFVTETIVADLGGRAAIADIDGDGLHDVALHV